MKGILKNTKAGWFVLYQVMRDEITSGYDSIPLHPDSQTWMDGYHLYEGKEVQFEIVMDKPDHTYSQTPYAKTIDEDALGCSYPDCICQGDEITYCNNRTPEQVVLGDKTALVEDVFHQGIENKHTQQVDFSNPNADRITSTSTTSIKQETLKDIKLEEVLESSHCQFSVIENKLAILYRNQEKLLKAIKLNKL
jgi:hypothetical protein